MDVRLKPQTRAPQITSQPPALAAAEQQSPPTETVERVRDDYSTQADIYNASRNVGNQVSEAVTGVVGHVSGNVGLVLPTIGETYRNLWKAETIGPYAKTVGSIVALAGIPLVAGGALISSPFLGVAEAFKDEGYNNAPLVDNSTADVAKRITSADDGPDTLLGKAIQNMQEFGDKKLAPGEEPWDIPVNKIFKGALEGLNFLMVKVPVQVGKAIYKGGKATYKAGKTAVVESAKAVKKYGPKLAMAAAAGVTSTLIAGPAGLVIGVGISAVMAARDVKDAIFDKDRSIGSRAGGIAKTLAYIPVGPVMAGMSVKENFGRSFSEGWNGHPVEAIKTTGKAVIEKAKEALKGRKAGDQSCNISTNTPKVPVRSIAKEQTPETEKTITEKIVDGTVDSTLAATDRVSGAISGLATGTAAYLSKMPSLAADGFKSAANLYRAEKIGPNIKVVATLASPVIAGVAVAGAGLGLVVAAGAGLVTGFSAHDSDKPRDFTIDEAVSKAWNKTRESVSEFGDDAIKSSQDIREIEVKPGDKLWDIPLPPFARTAKTAAATVAGLAMGGIGGIATAIATTATSAWSGVKNAVTDFSAANVLGAVGAVVASPVTGALHGLSKVVTTPIKAAATAWKQDSLGAALKDGGKECFDTAPSAAASAAGGLVGGAVAALPAAAVTGLATTAVELGRGLKTAATDKELNFPGKALAAVGGIVSAPAAGVIHGIATGVGTPFVSAAKAWDNKSLSGIGAGLKASHDGTQPVANAGGALVGGAVVGTLSATAATASAAVREIGGGLVDAATNKELNVRGKVLDGLGGIAGDTIAAAGQGLGTLFATPLKAAEAAFESGKASEGAKAAADFGVKSVHAAVRPQAMVETVEV